MIRPTSSALFSSTKATGSTSSTKDDGAVQVPLYRAEGLFSVIKPLDWTSSDVVSFVRKMLERDARERGAKPVRVGSRRNKSRIIKVGHGGTLDPLATGVLVVGVGKGTKELQSYLTGSKRYLATGEFGFETNTLDMDPIANITQRAPFEHITLEDLEQNTLPKFVGDIQQVPPIFSAIRRNGKRLYEQARQGVSQEDLKIEPRQVTVHSLKLLHMDGPNFSIDMECGGGTYVRSLIRDIAYDLDSVATMTSLERTKQGQFTQDTALPRDEWSPDNIYDAISKFNAQR
ncbi:pseudouridine synthase B [Seminavis robusta]|uniref:tRNA pseudouridine(55) synthase n=1 Tax=Seminavis robusta TaxID=568900 RepID=A0A9N8D9R1_9STRA|nr:pseudouridine synthase B [Seminavis robusta]|eukprot:Sro9_g007670.1 pseudouridine synthase B (288) ;mRNA; r:213272-214135